ncbi:ABC transporter permease subunit [Tundrisphaera lichenicola]|uniref:ABC transporter permease subunit n=1 Tax=Tundrisphaera lichenicola TaxID=2029860 RepID=UPI003EB7FFF8
MILGPVFRAELLRTARRRRYYAARFVYGLLLLFIIWIGYASATAVSSTVTIDQVARFAEETFIRFAVVQLIAILLMIPALFGGAIADEKQRKTLHYLMASRLSSFEIVVDKVLGRAPHLAVFLALGLPIVSLLGLFGGVPPEYVAIAYIGTFSTASFAVALTVLVSTMARKVRQAVLIAYVLMLGWQFIPVMVWGFGSRLYPATYSWIEPVVDWVGATCPLTLYVRTMMFMGRTTRGPWAMVEPFAWMVGLQLAGAGLMILLAVWQLRPTFRRHAEARPRRGWFGRADRGPRARRRIWDRPECGDDAMGWKERYFIQTDAFTRMVVLPATVLVSVVLILVVGIDETLRNAFVDLWRAGLSGWGNGDEKFLEQIRVFSAWYVAIWLLAVAGSSASSVTVEREEDTWVSLTSTPLTAREILRGKALGAIWAQRGFAAVPLGLWTIGLLVGSIHPLGFLGALLMFGLVTWLVASVGVHASLRANSTSKALTSTITALFVLSGYPAFLLWSFLEYGVWDRYVSFVGLPARLAVGPLVSYSYVSREWTTLTVHGYRQLEFINYIVIGLILLVVYEWIAAILTLRAFRRFDAWLDRPRMTLERRPDRKPAPTVSVSEPGLQS